jgi:tetratricopeptide (TPR) repeat protein
MNVEKLKITALKHEKREDWRKAIDVYLMLIEAYESGSASSQDFSVYNRLGDLYIKVNSTSLAVQSYERAVDLYADQGRTNQAIALCGKVLRVNPGRVQIYLKLARLHAEKNVVVDSQRNLLEYLERMNALGNRDDALEEVKAFADRFGRNEDVRVMLSALLRAMSRDPEAQEQLEKLAEELESRGDAEGTQETGDRSDEVAAADRAQEASPSDFGLVFLDTGTGSGGPAPTEEPPGQSPGSAEVPVTAEDTPPADLDIDRGRYEEETDVLEVESVGDLEHTSLETEDVRGVAALDGLLVDGADELSIELDGPAEELDVTTGYTEGDEDEVTLEVVPDEDIEAESLEDEVTLEVVPEVTLEVVPDEDIDTESLETVPSSEPVAPLTLDPMDEILPGEPTLVVELDEADTVEVPLAPIDIPVVEEPVEVEAAAGSGAGTLEFLQIEEPVGPTVEELEDRILDNPDDPAAHRALGESLIADGEVERGIEELELALQQYEKEEDWSHASDIVTELLRLEPNRIAFYQKRVELAFRSGEKSRLVEAYLALGDVLVRVGSMQKAIAVYGRVLEHDPENTLADAALHSLEPAADAPSAPVVSTAAAEASAKFVDLGKMVLEPKKPKDARIRIQRTQPTGDESQDFAEILQQFKQGIEETIEASDFQSHYDLGIAFKEMGLLDEAIAEFQKALRAPDGRLRTSEALGVSFYEKGQFPVAEAILKRAIDSLAGPDNEKIGLLYWLGRAREDQGKTPEALICFRRALAVDVDFMDLGERVALLTGGDSA